MPRQVCSTLQIRQNLVEGTVHVIDENAPRPTAIRESLLILSTFDVFFLLRIEVGSLQFFEIEILKLILA